MGCMNNGESVDHMTDKLPINNTVKFLQIVKSPSLPKGDIIMAPQFVFDKVGRGEPLTDDDLALCVYSHGAVEVIDG